MNETYRSIPLAGISPNLVLSAPVYDARERRSKLLGSGVRLTNGRINRLQQLGVTHIAVSLRDVATSNMFKPQGVSRRVPSDHAFPQSTVKNEETEILDGEIDDGEELSVVAPGNPIANESIDRSLDFYNQSAVRELTAQFESNLRYLDDLYRTFLASGVPDISGLEVICQHCITSIMADKDLFACLGGNPFGIDYPVRHSLHVASLAISIGMQMGLDDENLIELGVGCLVHDLGMLRVESRVHEKKERLDERDLTLVSDHPVHTLNYLGFARASVSTRSRMVAYQIHERCDGSGYPRGRKAEQIHDLAKIAAVADVYVGLVASRSFRKGLQPYRAVEKLLFDMRAGLFDPRVIRALLETVSLFPIGSYVNTNEGQTAQVIRSNGKQYDRPVIEIVGPKWTHKSRVVDLAQVGHLHVVKTTAFHGNAGISNAC